jgi:peroxiredoxin Q/BCP
MPTKKIELQEGDRAPSFKLQDQTGMWHRLSHHRGGWVLLYFYPKDDTPGCTKEACAIRDYFPNFKKLKAKVFGVSVDSVASHAKFAKKYKLPFTLLSDEEKLAVRTYGVWGKKKFMGRVYEGTLRTSFLIDPKGKIRKIYRNVNPAVHAGEVLADLKALRNP